MREAREGEFLEKSRRGNITESLFLRGKGIIDGKEFWGIPLEPYLLEKKVVIIGRQLIGNTTEPSTNWERGGNCWRGNLGKYHRTLIYRERGW